MLLALFCAALAVHAAPSPKQLRVDLHLSHRGVAHGLFITLDPVYPQQPTPSPLLLSWALPPTLPVQRAYRLLITTATSLTANATVFDSGWAPSAAQRAGVPRSLLQPAREYAWTVAVQGADGSASAWAPPQRFFTSGGAGAWAASAPIWPASCSGGGPPRFARFHADIALGAPRDVLSALLFITGSPPIYTDPWNVTKLLGGYKLAVNGSVFGVGPGRTSCGPLRPGIHQQVSLPSSGAPLPALCDPVQPVDGYDVSAAVRAALAAALPLPLDIASYGLVQEEYALVPAMQAVLHVRWSPEGSAPDLLVGTAPAAPWLALDSDALYSPGSNKAPFWYTQPREDVNLSCLPPLPTSGAPLALGSACSACGWGAPGAVPRAWVNGTVPLAGKTTQALSYSTAQPVAAATAQLGQGWWRLDAGVEFQGGLRITLLPGAPIPSAGARAIVQLGSELVGNGSVMWNSRAGNHYQDAWTFPSAVPHQERVIEHHEYCEFRYAELIWSAGDGSGTPLPLLPGVHFEAEFWVVRYPFDSEGAARVETSSADLDAVFALAASTIKTTTLDFFADSNTRQRSIDCMADDTTAALSQYGTTTELAFQRMTAAQIMGITQLGYISGNWADWTILPGLNIFYDALFTGDLTLAAAYFDVLMSNHTYVRGRCHCPPARAHLQQQSFMFHVPPPPPPPPPT